MEKILLLDHDPASIQFIDKALKDKGYAVVTHPSDCDPCGLLSREGFDLVLMDCSLPHGDCIDILKRIKAVHPQTGIIITAEPAATPTALEALKNGAYDYIVKPFNAEGLSAAVYNCLEHTHLRRQENILRETTHLYQHAQEATAAQSEKDMLQSILERTVRTLQADAGSIFMYSSEAQKLTPMAVVGSVHVPDTEIRLGERIVGWVAQERKPLLIQNDFKEQPQFRDLPIRREIVSSMIAPLMNRDVLLGVVCVNRFTNGTNYQFTHYDLDSLQFFALHATLIVTTLREQQSLHQLDELKSEFVANVSHELRTPLMSISGAIELLSAPASLAGMTERSKMFLDLINRNSARMCRLVEELLDFSRIETRQLRLSPARFDMRALIDETVMDFDFRAKEKHITMTAEYATDQTEITADRERLKQVVTNLLNNAVKFTPENGMITVRFCLSGQQNVLMTVADSGIGIPGDKLDKIFQKFYQVDGSIARPQSGFGLGLAIVKSIVEAHKGRIWAESELSKGTTFFVELPRVLSESAS